MHYHVMTLFPEMINQGVNTSITGKAIKNGTIHLNAVNMRDFSKDKHLHVDDYPYGGGAGMVIGPQPVYDCYQSILNEIDERNQKEMKQYEQSTVEIKKPRVIYMTPQGSVFSQAKAEELSKEEDLIFLCGHYEGIDERVLEEIVTDNLSLGDYVLTGGELAAMVMIDAISRLVPGVLNNDESAQYESFQDGLLEYPQYTRPEIFHGEEVPKVLRSGNHKKIEDWRKKQSLERTLLRRPDLLEKAQLEKADLQKLAYIQMKYAYLKPSVKAQCQNLLEESFADLNEVAEMSCEKGKSALIIGEEETLSYQIPEYMQYIHYEYVSLWHLMDWIETVPEHMQFDLVMMTDALHRLYSKDAKKWLKFLNRHTNNNSVISMAISNYKPDESCKKLERYLYQIDGCIYQYMPVHQRIELLQQTYEIKHMTKKDQWIFVTLQKNT